MNRQKRVEMPTVPRQSKVTPGTPRPEDAKVFEIGNVSVETKGTVAGLEQGFTPKF